MGVTNYLLSGMILQVGCLVVYKGYVNDIGNGWATEKKKRPDELYWLFNGDSFFMVYKTGCLVFYPWFQIFLGNWKMRVLIYFHDDWNKNVMN